MVRYNTATHWPVLHNTYIYTYIYIDITVDNIYSFNNSLIRPRIRSCWTNWVFTSVPMMKVIETRCHGCQMNSPDKSIQWTKHINGYVDDKRQYTNECNNSKLSTVLNKMHPAAQTWEHLLLTSGGKLEIDKCAAFIISWKFTEDGIQIIINNNNIPPIIIQSNRQIKLYH